jgi:hypothetical protein
MASREEICSRTFPCSSWAFQSLSANRIHLKQPRFMQIVSRCRWPLRRPVGERASREQTGYGNSSNGIPLILGLQK